MSTKREQKEKAREMLMHGIGNVIGYWSEQEPDAATELGITEDELHAIIRKEADRVASLFGYEYAWGN